MISLLSLIVSILFIEIYINSKDLRWIRIAYIIIAAIGCYSDYYFVFILASQFICLLITHKGEAFRKYLFDITILILLLLPLLIVLLVQRNILTQQLMNSNMGYIGKIKILLSNCERLILPAFSEINSRYLRWASRVAFLLILTLACVKKGFFSAGEHLVGRIYLFLVLFPLAIWATIITGLFPAETIETRYLMTLYPLIIVLIGYLISLINRKWAAILFFSIILGGNTSLAIIHFSQLSRVQDCREVAKYLHQNESPEEKVFIYPNFYEYCFKTYYKGINTILPIPRQFNYEKYNPKSHDIETNQELQIAFGAFALQSKFWVVVFKSSKNDGSRILFEYLEKYNQLSHTTFARGEMAILYNNEKVNHSQD
jgi:hypothetical protein